MLTFLKHTYCLIGLQIELLNASRKRPLYRVGKQRRSSSITTWRLPSNRWWRTSRVIIVSTVSKSPCGGHKFINWNTSLIEIFMICHDVVKSQFCLRKYYFSIIIPPTSTIMCTISGKICVQTIIHFITSMILNYRPHIDGDLPPPNGHLLRVLLQVPGEFGHSRPRKYQKKHGRLVHWELPPGELSPHPVYVWLSRPHPGPGL